MQFYDNAFSPFARKVRMVLEYKSLAFDAIDGLDRDNHETLAAVNPRAEVPALVDGDLTIVNSADIVAYLEHRHAQPAVYPDDPGTRARARAWERCADTVIDPILVDISYWLWAERKDEMPKGLRAAAAKDMDEIYQALEDDLDGNDFLCGGLSIADIALFPHMTSTRAMGVAFSKERYPRLTAWLNRMRTSDIGAADIARTKEFLSDIAGRNLETERIFWRGDRIEWLLARGYHQWFMGEIEAGRVIWPGLGVPT